MKTETENHYTDTYDTSMYFMLLFHFKTKQAKAGANSSQVGMEPHTDKLVDFKTRSANSSNSYKPSRMKGPGGTADVGRLRGLQ